MEIAGYIASVLIGVSLGLIGGGGSILTVPVLVYLFGLDAVSATAYSLFIVGLTAAVGSVSYFRQKLVNVRTAIVFGLPSIVAVFLTRAWLIPAIPKTLFLMGDVLFTRDLLLLILFAVLMIVASFSMIRKGKEKADNQNKKQEFNYPVIFLEGTLVGTFTGLVGAGGGFLIIPALVVLSRLPMKQAVGTSLVIIAAKSLIGFLGESGETVFDWSFLSGVSALAVFGVFIGNALAKRIDGEKLKPAFGWFVLAMGVYILVKELSKLF